MRQNDTFVWGFSMLIKILLILVMYIRLVDGFLASMIKDEKTFSFYFLLKCKGENENGIQYTLYSTHCNGVFLFNKIYFYI